MSLKKKILIGVLVLLVAIGGFLVYYINDYYRASNRAITISETMSGDGNLYFKGNTKRGFIVYPGGKVDEKAYAPLAKELSKQGDSVIIVKMPFHLSILDSNKAEKVISENPEIEEWYIIGHSLGGTSASIFVEEHTDKVEGVVFLGSYTYKNLSNLDVEVLTITGDKDKVVNRDKIKAAKKDYPKDVKHIVLEGGNHAYFGDYDEQSGDGKATLKPKEQQKMTAEYIFHWIAETNNK